MSSSIPNVKSAFVLFHLVCSVHLMTASSLCGSCPFVQIPDEPCKTKWIPQYGKARADVDCECLKGYSCCPTKCVDVDTTLCKKGKEIPVLGQDCCNCATLQCARCPPIVKEDQQNCGFCFKYSKVQNETTGCYEATCKRKESPKYPPVKCSECETEVVEMDSCGYEKPTCRKNPCPCDPVPSCFGSQVLTAQTGACGCQKWTCGCERQCPAISEPVCDDRGNLHQNWCAFGIAACKLEPSLQILKIAPLSHCQGKGYEELRDFGSKWRRFWWFDAKASNSIWPSEEKDVLGHAFGSCAPNASHCFGRLPEHLRQDSTLLLAIDGKGNAYKWRFDSGNPTSNAVWRAFHDHAETKAGAIKNNKVWNPEVMAGSRPSASRDQDSFMYRDQFGLKSVILDDDNCDCLSTLSMGSGMCLQGQETRYGPARVFGVDNLDDAGCNTPEPTKSLSLYFNEQ